jgi:hypothetical protein
MLPDGTHDLPLDPAVLDVLGWAADEADRDRLREPSETLRERMDADPTLRLRHAHRGWSESLAGKLTEIEQALGRFDGALVSDDDPRA